MKVVGKGGTCCLNCVLKLFGLVWYGKVFICIVISEFVPGGVQILYQRCLMTDLCLKPHVKGLCAPLQRAGNLKYLKSAADNIIDEFSPCIPGVKTKGSLRVLQYLHNLYKVYCIHIIHHFI